MRTGQYQLVRSTSERMSAQVELFYWAKQMEERAKKGSLKGLICTVEDCGNPMYSRLMCKRHYKQLHRTGTAKLGIKGMHGTPEERFWNYVEKGAPDECWEWQGNRDKDGYGSLRTKTSQVRAHRVSFQMHNDESIDRLVVRHKCNNPPCVNPKHLLCGTHTENMSDKVLAGTVLLNERHPNCKFSNKVVELVRLATGKRKDIAKHFGMSASQVGNIRSGAQRPIITKEE